MDNVRKLIIVVATVFVIILVTFAGMNMYAKKTANNQKNVENEESEKTFVTDDGFTYSIDDNNDIIIKNFSPYEKREEVIVPENIDGHTVKYIDGMAFSFNQYVKKIVIANTVESIGEQTFQYCVKLEAVEVPASVVEIKDPNRDGADDKNLSYDASISIFNESENAKMYVEENSYSETYCKSHKIKYEIIKK